MEEGHHRYLEFLWEVANQLGHTALLTSQTKPDKPGRTEIIPGMVQVTRSDQELQRRYQPP